MLNDRSPISCLFKAIAANAELFHASFGFIPKDSCFDQEEVHLKMTGFKNRRRSLDRATLLAGTILFVLPSEIADAAGFETLRPHRAIYEIGLKESTERSGIKSMSGRIVYEMEGNECDGMSVRYRFVSRVNANGDIFTTDQQTASYETPDGQEYTFVTKNFVNDRLERVTKGRAEQTETAIEVSIDEPDEKTLELPKAEFISTHLVRMIEEAKAGTPFFQMRVFDGGDGADETLTTSNIIGKPEVVKEVLPGEKSEALERIGEETAWPVTVGYFKDALTNSTEATPTYEVSFLLYEGGISRRLTLRYPDYSLTGTLVGLEMLSQAPCTMEN